jgi:predicted AAA+ superfamily ATPase
MAAAANSPESFLRGRPRALIIDEVQLVPEIFRALKTIVDEMRQAKGGKVQGQFLLTGSANILALPKLADSLVGRMATLTLYPLSGAEVTKGKGGFIDRLFSRDFTGLKTTKKLLDVMRGATCPEIANASDKDRQLWFEGYITTILQRDVRALAEIEKLSALPNLLRILANRAGGLMNDADVARDAGLNPMTTRSYKTLLKMLFLTFEIAPWYRNIGKRLVKSPKGYLVDSALLCHLLDYKLEVLEKERPALFGHVLENFVASELLKLTSGHDDKINLLHFRTADNKEVDFVLEKSNGKLAGVEVKKSDHVTADDFKGLITLRELAGKDFVCGVVFYNGRDLVPFGDKLWAVPLAFLWQ